VTDDLLTALQANLALLREVGLRYDVATDNHTHKGENMIQTPEDVAGLCADMLPMVQEQLRVLLLNTKQAVIDVVTVYQGTVNSASVRVAEVLRPALLANAPNIVLVHNHPSGDTEPSGADLQITRKVIEGARLMDIEVHDHVVVAAGAAPTSMRRRGVGGFCG
jgi:DNA repair protein RadC